VVTVETTGATGVLSNVTAVSPFAARFLSVRPGTATGRSHSKPSEFKDQPGRT
jgi:hypothetical protein